MKTLILENIKGDQIRFWQLVWHVGTEMQAAFQYPEHICCPTKSGCNVGQTAQVLLSAAQTARVI